jgi:hypothetical protein
MDDISDRSLKLMTRSLQEHIHLANALNMGFTAQLLSMAVMEIKINMHAISQQEVDALCDHIEEKSSVAEKRPVVQAPVVPAAIASAPISRSHDRRSRMRRSRAQ